jgi:class 3 adenylate cyclase/predicted ATPase
MKPYHHGHRSMQQVADWLEKLGLGQYAARFAENDIDFALLTKLNDADLKELGVTSLGHRKRLLEAIAERAAATPSPAPAAPKAPDTAERRQVTVMFSDLVGSTALSARMDPEDLREVISAYQKCVAETVQRFGGFVAKYMGDGVLVYFGYPEAHEDDAERAVRAGLELIQAVDGLRSSFPLQTRVGIATGLVVVGDLIGLGAAQEQAVVGETPNLAARLQGIAEPNAVVIAEGTRKLLGNLFDLQDLGAQDLKGMDDPVRAWTALRPASVESRFEALHGIGLTELVGREEELEILLRRWSKAKTGEGQVVLLSGEAGIGKSRLTAALLESIASEPHTRLRYFCSAQHTDSALYPIISQMERAAGFAHNDALEAKLGKLDAVLAQTSTSKQDATLLADMLSLPNDGRYPILDLTPEQRRQRTLQALLSQMEALTRQTVLMIFEDAHWTDPTSLELFGRIVDRIPSLRVLLIVTFRPEIEPPWIGRPYVTALTINRLAQRDIEVMIDRVVGNKSLPANIRHDIIERTDGIPLFVEEMTKAVLEGEAERTAAAVPSPTLAVPASLQASLMARLDRLGPAKEVAQIGAVIGREFSYELLAAVSPLHGNQLADALSQLEVAGLVFARGARPRSTYTFKHALVQDTAYGTLLRGKRQQLHARIAEALPRLFPERAAVEPELLANHYTEAAQIEDAIEYWRRAGTRAIERSANTEAIAHLSKGLRLVENLPEDTARGRQEVALRSHLGIALMSTKGFGASEVRDAFARVRELCDRLGDAPGQFAATWNLWMYNGVASQVQTARDLSDELLVLANRKPDSHNVLQARHAAWTTRFLLGEFEAAWDHAKEGVRLYDLEEHRSHAFLYGGHDPGVCCRSFGSHARWLLGYPAQADTLVHDALAAAEARGHPLSMTQAPCAWAVHAQLRREPEKACEMAQRTAAVAQEHGFTRIFYAGIGRAVGHWATAMLVPDAGIARMRAEIESLRSIGIQMFRPYYLALLGECCRQVGAVDEGLSVLEEAQTTADCTGEHWWDAELYRLKGELLLSQSRQNRSEAETCFDRALAVAHSQNAKSLELRAAMSMARLWRDQSKRNEAHDLLAPVYGWFTEGFDTLDLKEAKALLDELHA